MSDHLLLVLGPLFWNEADLALTWLRGVVSEVVESLLARPVRCM
jgi:hypothetical protein